MNYVCGLFEILMEIVKIEENKIGDKFTPSSTLIFDKKNSDL